MVIGSGIQHMEEILCFPRITGSIDPIKIYLVVEI